MKGRTPSLRRGVVDSLGLFLLLYQISVATTCGGSDFHQTCLVSSEWIILRMSHVLLESRQSWLIEQYVRYKLTDRISGANPGCYDLSRAGALPFECRYPTQMFHLPIAKGG